jgi:hypothetical protein
VLRPPPPSPSSPRSQGVGGLWLHDATDDAALWSSWLCQHPRRRRGRRGGSSLLLPPKRCTAARRYASAQSNINRSQHLSVRRAGEVLYGRSVFPDYVLLCSSSTRRYTAYCALKTFTTLVVLYIVETAHVFQPNNDRAVTYSTDKLKMWFRFT